MNNLGNVLSFVYNLLIIDKLVALLPFLIIIDFVLGRHRRVAVVYPYTSTWLRRRIFSIIEALV